MKKLLTIVAVTLSICVLCVGCGTNGLYDPAAPWEPESVQSVPPQDDGMPEMPSDIAELPAEGVTGETLQAFQIPEYTGELVMTVNGGEPFFTEAEKASVSQDGYEQYSELDALGRCGTAFACVNPRTMPTEERGDISKVKPTGWNQAKYGDTWAYERCHLIAFCLTGENANPNNLITGTHDMNQAMIPYEVEIAQWCENFNGDCLVRVTPCFVGDELVARGVLYEAYSIESEEIRTCVFIHNVSDLFTIDYATGITTEK